MSSLFQMALAQENSTSLEPLILSIISDAKACCSMGSPLSVNTPLIWSNVSPFAPAAAMSMANMMDAGDIMMLASASEFDAVSAMMLKAYLL